MQMYTLGHDFVPPGIHAGGLRYHGDSPLVSQLLKEELIEAVAVPQLATFEAGVSSRAPRASSRRRSPATASAPASTRRCAARRRGEPKTLFFNLSGHGHFDMASYDRYFSGELEDYEYPDEAIHAALEHLPKVRRECSVHARADRSSVMHEDTALPGPPAGGGESAAVRGGQGYLFGGSGSGEPERLTQPAQAGDASASFRAGRRRAAAGRGVHRLAAETGRDPGRSRESSSAGGIGGVGLSPLRLAAAGAGGPHRRHGAHPGRGQVEAVQKSLEEPSSYWVYIAPQPSRQELDKPHRRAEGRRHQRLFHRAESRAEPARGFPGPVQDRAHGPRSARQAAGPKASSEARIAARESPTGRVSLELRGASADVDALAGRCRVGVSRPRSAAVRNGTVTHHAICGRPDRRHRQRQERRSDLFAELGACGRRHRRHRP